VVIGVVGPNKFNRFKVVLLFILIGPFAAAMLFAVPFFLYSLFGKIHEIGLVATVIGVAYVVGVLPATITGIIHQAVVYRGGVKRTGVQLVFIGAVTGLLVTLAMLFLLSGIVTFGSPAVDADLLLQLGIMGAWSVASALTWIYDVGERILNLLGKKMTENEFSNEYSDEEFWNKVKKYAKVVGENVLEPALKMYYSATDADTPAWAKTTIYGALGYFISPIDAIPDITPVIGYTDDFGVLFAAVSVTAAYIKEEHIKKAKTTLAQWFS
jgi:uncharacterized membrane protein YkvA (DUF1232 family)